MMSHFEDKNWDLDNPMEGDHICSASEIFQDFDLALDFLFLHWFQCFHHTFFIVVNVDRLKHLFGLSYTYQLTGTKQEISEQVLTSLYLPLPSFLTS